MDHWALGCAHLMADHTPPKSSPSISLTYLPSVAYQGLPTSLLSDQFLFAKLMGGNDISFLFKFSFA